MDPLSVVGLVIGVGQVLASLSKCVATASHARKELQQLCSELFALKAALNHIEWTLQENSSTEEIGNEVASAPAGRLSDLLQSKEASDVVGSASMILSELDKQLTTVSNHGLQALKQKLSWSLGRDDTLAYVARLESVKTYFILIVTIDNAALSSETYRKVCRIESAVSTVAHNQQMQETGRLRTAVTSWLSPYDVRPAHDRARQSRHPGTGKWFLNGDFRSWTREAQSQPSAMLCLKGSPGTGKTTLLSSAIDILLRRRLDTDVKAAMGVAFFYCSFTDRATQEPLRVLASLIYQLCQQKESLWVIVEQRYRRAKDMMGMVRSLDVLALQDILLEVCRAWDRAFLIIDAPNESEKEQEIVQAVMHVAKALAATRVILTCNVIPLCLVRGGLRPIVVEMDKDSAHVDASDYLDTWIAGTNRVATLPERLRRDIKAQLLSKFAGSFRWLSCQMQALCSEQTAGGMRKALGRVPPTLEETYRNILMSVPERDKEYIRRALRWLLYTVRPLTVAEVAEAMIFNGADCEIGDDMRLLEPLGVLAHCRSLIHVDGLIRLAHSSVQVFLESQGLRRSEALYFSMNNSSDRQQVSQHIFAYLGLPSFQAGYCETAVQYERRIEDWPLYVYCANHWTEHTSSCLVPEALTDVYYDGKELQKSAASNIMPFLRTVKLPRGGNFGACVQCMRADNFILGPAIWNSKPLYFAAREGLVDVVEMILAESDEDLESRGGSRGSTPLHCAAALGHMDVVITLLQAGANAREHNAKGETGLQWAVAGGHDRRIAKALIDAGADPCVMDHPFNPEGFRTTNQTPLRHLLQQRRK